MAIVTRGLSPWIARIQRYTGGMGKIGGAVGAIVLLAVVSCSLTTSLEGLSGGPTTDGVVEAGGAAGESGAADGSEPEPGPTDASSDSFLQDVVAPVVDGCSMAGCFAMPAGFSLVAYGATAKGVACPTGFTAPADTVEGPTVGAFACTCSCSVTTQPSCPTGTLVGHFGAGGNLACGSAGGDLANNGCGTDGYLGPFDTGNEHQFKAPGATGGSCHASANKDPAKLNYAAQGRVCQAATTPECQGKVCPLAAAAPFGVCIAAVGDVACPAGFATKHLLGTSASFTCAAGCTCGVTATCKGKVNYFATGDCSGAAGMSVIVDDQCHSTDAMGVSFLSHAYVPFGPSNVSCNKTGSSAASTPALSQPTTVRCD